MIKLNVGLSKKVGTANYGSKGATVNIEAEVDSNLIQDPHRLKEQLRRLFGLARNSLEEELQPEELPSPGTRRDAPQIPETPRPATDAQCRTISGHARRQGIPLLTLIRDRTGKKNLDELSLSEASQLITYLKSRESLPTTQES